MYKIEKISIARIEEYFDILFEMAWGGELMKTTGRRAQSR